MTRKALGKGLSSLIPQSKSPREPKEKKAPVEQQSRPSEPRSGLSQIDIDLIQPNLQQPRRQFDPTALEELAQSLRADGLIQPVVVRPVDEGRFELIAGERRWRAAQAAGLLRIPALIRDVADTEMLQLALIENLQREELNPIETAVAFRSLIEDLGLTQSAVADRVGKPRSTIANFVRLLELPNAVQDRVKAGSISLGHAKALAGLSDVRLQKDLAERIVREQLSVRQVEQFAGRTSVEVAESKPTKKGPARDPNVVHAEETLQRAFGTKARIVQSAKGAGRVELHFHNDEELQRVYQILMGRRG